MVRWLLFFHVVGVAFWLGAATAAFMLHRQARVATHEAAMDLAQKTLRAVTKWVVHPSALIVLISGIGMIVHLGLVGQPKPFWFSIMEHGGGLLVMVTVAATGWLLHRLNRAPDESARKLLMTRLSHSLAGLGVGVLAIVFVVMLRIS